MRFQRFPWSCGSASVVNALRCFGICVNEQTVMGVAGTFPPAQCGHCKALKKAKARKAGKKELRKLARAYCKVGTDEIGVVTALQYFGNGNVRTLQYFSESRDDAWKWLHGTIVLGGVVILCLNRWSHWSVAIGMAGDSIVLCDSSNTAVNKKENGIHILNKEDLMQRWYNGAKWVDKEKRLYAISVEAM